MTLNQVADYICGQLGKPLDAMLKETVKFTVRAWTATLIRRDVEKNGMSQFFNRRVLIKLKVADSADSCSVVTGCKVLRSVNKMPVGIRLKGEDPFQFVGEVDGRDTWTFTRFFELKYTKDNKFTSRETRYDIVNGYLYVFTNGKYLICAVENPFSDLTKAIDFSISCSECLSDDDEYTLTDDMLQALIAGIKSGEFRLLTDNEVNINESDTANK